MHLDHFYSECPHPRRLQFCFRCGLFGRTIQDCPICQEDWRAQGPYIPGRGHREPEPPPAEPGLHHHAAAVALSNNHVKN
ncbi:vasa-like protein [Lasius niger]|uniref:Vasa-like protein n=1 Tax=Lasius niger TaxID=67767 RepID=A0A0J7KFJ4_LASNI|nr:vasa-like protein [Lasius niger]